MPARLPLSTNNLCPPGTSRPPPAWPGLPTGRIGGRAWDDVVGADLGLGDGQGQQAARIIPEAGEPTCPLLLGSGARDDRQSMLVWAKSAATWKRLPLASGEEQPVPRAAHGGRHLRTVGEGGPVPAGPRPGPSEGRAGRRHPAGERGT